MKSIPAKKFGIFLYTLIVMSGCTDPAGPSSNTLPSRSDVIQYLMHDSSKTFNSENIYGRLGIESIKRTSGELPDSVELFEYTLGQFLDLNTSTKPVDVGTIRLNGTPLSFESEIMWYGLENFKYNEDQMYSWNISGNNGYTAFDISCAAPSKTNITLPLQGDIINRANGVNVKWTGKYDAENIVLIFVRGKFEGKLYNTDDTGSFSIPAADLRYFGNGTGRIEVMRLRYNLKVITNNKYIFTTIDSFQSLDFKFIE